MPSPRTHKKVLLTGASGFLGWQVSQCVPKDIALHGTHHSSQTPPSQLISHRMDLTDAEASENLLEEIQPDGILHLAANSNTTYCEQHPAETRKINVEAAATLARWCAANQAALLYASSDLVFDGEHPPYDENARPAPVNVYGRQKQKAAALVQSILPAAVIARLPLMYGEDGPGTSNVLSGMVSALNQGRSLALFHDEYRTPAYGGDVAAFLWTLLFNYPGEVFHLGGPEALSRWDMGLLVAENFRLDPASLISTSQKNAKVPAPRPRDVSLDIGKARQLGFSPKRMKDVLPKLTQYF